MRKCVYDIVVVLGIYIYIFIATKGVTKKAETYSEALTGFKHMTSAIPVRCG